MASRSSGTVVHKEVRIDAPLSHSSSPSTAVEAAVSPVGQNEKDGPAKDKRKGIEWNPQKWKWPSYLAWVPGQLNYQGFKPVIRSSIAVWISFLLLFCTTTEEVAGQAAFLYLVVGFIQPPINPIMPTFINLCYNLIFVCLTWCVSVFSQLVSTRLRGYTTAEDAIRELQDAGYCGTTDPTTCLTDAIFDGYFLEIAPTVVNAVFFTIAISITLWVKAKYKQYVFACVFATISLVITMSYSPLFPYFDGTLGLLLIVPMGIQSAINFGCALFIWPHTVSWKYLSSLNSVLDHIKDGIAEQSNLLSISPMNLNEWAKYKIIQENVQKGKSIFVGMIPMEDFLTKEIAYCRFSGKEVKDLKGNVRKLLSGLGGFHYWYFLVEQKITVHMQSRPSTPIETPRSSQVSLNVNEMKESSLPKSQSKSHIHLPQLAALHKHYEPVGVLESQAFSDLESGTQTSLNEKPTHFEDLVLLVNETCSDLLKECVTGMDALHKWFKSVNSDRIYGRLFHRRARINERRECTVLLEQAIESLDREIQTFRNDKRFKVLEPHLKWFQSAKNSRQPSYRLLFASFFYQFHLLEFSTSLLSLLVELREHDVRQPLPKWWVPGIIEISKWLAGRGESSQNEGPHMDLAADDQDPELIPQTNSEEEGQRLLIQKRDPDAAPPTHIGHLIGRVIVKSYKLLTRPDIFFAIKASIITVLTATMQWAPATAAFWYDNRGVWVVIMCALTISQFTADTIFGFVVRIFGTFFGALLGMVIWYMGSGSGTGNPYALLAILGVLLPFIMFIRNNFVFISPMPAIIFCITIALIIGYSWRDTHFASPSVLGYGFSVAYRRFLAVSAGITIGVIGSLLPTPLSGRSMIRATCSRTITELGQLHSDLQEYAYRRLHSMPGSRGEPEESIGLRQIAIQVKLNATKAQIAVQKFEPPLQGNWPGGLYSELVALQVELIDLYGSFHSLLQQLEPIWVESLLERNGWSDVHFVADQFAVIYMCANATKTGNALPQVTPSPLVDRFYTRMAGLKIAKVNRKGIPRDVDTETLHDWQYSLYAIGCTLSFAICYRLDRLMMITKALVGEVYQIEHFKSRFRLDYPVIPPELKHIYSVV